MGRHVNVKAVPAQAYVGKFLETFKEYPPRQKAVSFSLEKAREVIFFDNFDSDRMP